jgi:hypothetical protein
MSHLDKKLCEIMEGYQTFYLYKDPSYKHLYGVMALFKHPQGRFALAPYKQKANEQMSSVRIAIKHAFGHT